MKKILTMIVVLMFGLTTSLFAQTPAAKLPTAGEVKETLKQDAKAIKRDAVKMKDAVKRGVKEDVKETKESVKEVKKAVTEETKTFKK